jgi:hypothetical protein
MQRSIRFFRGSLGGDSAKLLEQRSVPPLEPSLVGNTTFMLKGHHNARLLALAGSFNGWDSQHLLCGKQPEQWTCRMNPSAWQLPMSVRR